VVQATKEATVALPVHGSSAESSLPRTDIFGGTSNQSSLPGDSVVSSPVCLKELSFCSPSSSAGVSTTATTPSSCVSPVNLFGSPMNRVAMKRKGPPPLHYKDSHRFESTQSLAQYILHKELATPPAMPDIDELPELTRIVDSKRIYDTMRIQFETEFMNKKRARDITLDEMGEAARTLRMQARIALKRLGDNPRIQLIDRCLQSDAGSSFSRDLITDLKMKQAHLKAQIDVSKRPKERFFVRNKNVILTYHSDSLIVPNMRSNMTMAEVVREVQCLTTYFEIWNEFRNTIHDAAEHMPFPVEWSAAMEVCTQTYANEHYVRLHFHAGLTAFQVIVFRSPAESGFMFKNMVPKAHTNGVPGVSFASSGGHSGSSKSSGRHGGHSAVHYYLQCEAKIGSVFRDGSKKPFSGYMVRPAWITGWLQVSLICATSISCLFVNVAAHCVVD